MGLLAALGSGIVGACALTAIHETARKTIPNAPRIDVLGKRAIAHTLSWAGAKPAPDKLLHDMALTGDILSNSVYYSLVALGGPRGAVACGAALGLAAGVGAVALPERMGLGSAPSARTTETKAMTVAWYLAGGLAAGLTYSRLTRKR
jgi:hypothetical protein